jgi:hypothetical protein
VRAVAPRYASAAARAHQDAPEQLWKGVREAVALANGVSPDEVTQHTRLDERGAESQRRTSPAPFKR